MSVTPNQLQVGTLIHERYLTFFKFLSAGFAALGAAAFFTPFAQENTPFGVTRELMLIFSFVGLTITTILLVSLFATLDKELGWKENLEERQASKEHEKTVHRKKPGKSQK